MKACHFAFLVLAVGMHGGMQGPEVLPGTIMPRPWKILQRLLPSVHADGRMPPAAGRICLLWHEDTSSPRDEGSG